MPSYIGYSPWHDAAAVGQGIGSSIAKVLFEIPAMKRRIEQEDRQLGLQERQVAAQEQNAQAMQGYRQEQVKNQRLGNVTRSMGQLLGLAQKQPLVDSQRALNELKLSRAPVEEAENALKTMAQIAMWASQKKKHQSDIKYNTVKENLYPEQVANDRLGRNIQAEALGLPGLPPINVGRQPAPAPIAAPVPQAAPPTLMPMSIPQQGVNLPSLNIPQPTMSAPPTPFHRIKMRNVRTGEEDWFMNAELAGAEWEVVQ